ncbi:MAG: hypothetical protein U9R22_04775 [Pseudomonadota bacterium]|jgi:hypothetical protein|nr:hypothetical protein [Pseudomonadota bacterium]
MSDTENLLLEKVTLNYVAVEDRISMRAQVRDGEVRTFWLTQRMCGQVVKAFVEYLDRNTAGVAATAPSGKSMVQSYFQQEAMLKRTRTPSVDASASTEPPLLVKTLKIRTSPRALVLRLPLPDDATATLPLRPREARQMLQILHGQYRKAGWPMDIWPRWITDSGDPGQVGDKGPLH